MAKQRTLLGHPRPGVPERHPAAGPDSDGMVCRGPWSCAAGGLGPLVGAVVTDIAAVQGRAAPGRHRADLVPDLLGGRGDRPRIPPAAAAAVHGVLWQAEGIA